MVTLTQEIIVLCLTELNDAEAQLQASHLLEEVAE